MEIDSSVKAIPEFLSGCESGISVFDMPQEEIVNKLPDGWKKLIGPLTFLVSICSNLQFLQFNTERGLLRVKGLSILLQELDLFNRVAQSVARDSSSMCMACGKRGMRRRYDNFWPCLCNVHYIQYLNWIDENK